MRTQRIPPWLILLTGDILMMAVVTFAGFATHDRRDAVSRMATTFFPLLAAWLMVAPWLGQFRGNESRLLPALLRTTLAAFIAAPMAALLRGLWLNSPILPIFVLVLAATSALGLGLWRAAWYLWRHRQPREAAHG